jgi:hypothetical protein
VKFHNPSLPVVVSSSVHKPTPPDPPSTRKLSYAAL